MLCVMSVIAVLICCAHGQSQCQLCSISCSRDEAIPIKYIGPPGKRGSIGLPGPHGAVGQRGFKGEDCTACDCRALKDQLQSIKHSTDGLISIVRDEWHKAGNSLWYKLFRTKVGYQKARDTCTQNGARLASAGIRNTTAFSEVILLTGIQADEFVWIGLTDLADEGVWLWEDGSTEPVSNWRSHQPDNSGGIEDCVHIGWDQHRLNDNNCNNTLAFLCEIALI